MNLHTLSLALLALAAATFATTSAQGPDGDDAAPTTEQAAEHAPEDALERWTDHHRAGQDGEGRQYFEAILAAATVFDETGTDELRARLRPHVDALETEARWINFMIALMPVEGVKDLPWPLIAGDIIRLQGLVGTNLSNIQFGLADGAERIRLQAAVFQVERELPVIRTAREALVDRVTVEILGGSINRSGVDMAISLRARLAQD